MGRPDDYPKLGPNWEVGLDEYQPSQRPSLPAKGAQAQSRFESGVWCRKRFLLFRDAKYVGRDGRECAAQMCGVRREHIQASSVRSLVRGRIGIVSHSLEQDVVDAAGRVAQPDGIDDEWNIVGCSIDPGILGGVVERIDSCILDGLPIIGNDVAARRVGGGRKSRAA